MPTYEFQCKKCEEIYEENVPMANEKYKGVKCPKCKSARKERLYNRVASFSFTNPVGTDRWTSDAAGHDYRYKYSKKSVAEQRKYAEHMSHVGPTPYRNIDDISSGENFGEVK